MPPTAPRRLRRHAPQPTSRPPTRRTPRNQNPTRCQFPDQTSTNTNRSRVQTQTARSGHRSRTSNHRRSATAGGPGPPTQTPRYPTRPPRHPPPYRPAAINQMIRGFARTWGRGRSRRSPGPYRCHRRRPQSHTDAGAVSRSRPPTVESLYLIASLQGPCQGLQGSSGNLADSGVFTSLLSLGEAPCTTSIFR